MKTLEALIAENEDWLVDRVVHYAVAQGFSEYTSTLREAWRASICGLSGPILDAISAAEDAPDADAGFGEARKTIVAFGVEQAMRHRARGVRLAEFLGLLKYYRRAYLDLIDDNQMDSDDARRLRGYVLEFFDQVEIGLCTEWNAASGGERLRDLQHQNQRLTNEKNKYLTIFESIREPVILLDEDDRPIHLNHAANRLFCGVSAPGASYYGALSSPLLNSQIAAILKGAVEGSYDDAIETLSGPREFNVNIQKMLDVSRKFDGTVIILNDVSEYKRALRQAEAADQAKSVFLAAMSHEIRTPIAGVLGLARLLRDTPLSDTQNQQVDGIISSGELLAGVVGDILDFSQAEVGGHPPVPEDFDLAALVHQVLMVVERQAKEKGLRLKSEISPELPAKLRGDTSMIRQVLLNLAHNAIKFTDIGTITLAATPLEPTVNAARRVRFEVSDTGIGLPDGPSGWLFDPFTQNDRRGDGLKGGVGLGLSICDKIVRRMGGDISCRSAPENGSVFRVDLPLDEAQSASLPPKAPVRTTNAAVLVVDDDEVNRTVATGFLEKLGHQVLSVSSACEAMQHLQSETFDLVLTDNRMPETSGMELLQQIRDLRNNSNAQIPVLVVTASAKDLKVDSAGPARPDGVLTKPYDLTDLAMALSAHLPSEPRCPTSGRQSPVSATDDPGESLTVLKQHISHLGMDRSQRIIQAFLDGAPRRLDELKAGISTNDRPAVSAAAHALAGASSLIGLSKTASSARNLEAWADDPARVLSGEEITLLDSRLETARHLLNELLEPPSGR